MESISPPQSVKLSFQEPIFFSKLMVTASQFNLFGRSLGSIWKHSRKVIHNDVVDGQFELQQKILSTFSNICHIWVPVYHPNFQFLSLPTRNQKGILHLENTKISNFNDLVFNEWFFSNCSFVELFSYSSSRWNFNKRKEEGEEKEDEEKEEGEEEEDEDEEGKEDEGEFNDEDEREEKSWKSAHHFAIKSILKIKWAEFFSIFYLQKFDFHSSCNDSLFNPSNHFSSTRNCVFLLEYW